MNDKRVLVVSYFFPPAGTTGVIRIAKFVHYLPRFGWSPVVIASSDPGVWHDPSLLDDVPSDVSVTRVGVSLSATRRSDQEDKGFADSTKTGFYLGSIKDKFKQLLKEYLLIPDPMILWVPGAVRAGVRLCRREDVDVIWASGGPWSNHLAAALVGLIGQKPVVLDFRDEWALGPPFDPRSPWRRWWDHTLERLVVRQAERIVVVLDDYIDDLKSRYPEFPLDKMVCIPNGFDPDRKVNARKAEDSGEQLMFLYTGKMGGFRSARYLLQAIAVGFETGVLHPDQIELVFVGDETDDPWDKRLDNYVAQYDLKEVVLNKPPVSYGDVLRLQSKADVLLVFKGYGEVLAGGNMPAKLVDYLGAYKPVLALAPQGSVIHNLVIRAGVGVCADPEDTEDILDKIEKLVKTRGSELVRNETEISAYSRVEQTRRLANLFCEVVDGCRVES